MTSKYWIKLHIEILDDPKMGRMEHELWRRTVELFLVAGEHSEEGKLPPVSDLAWRLRWEEDYLLDVLQTLETYKITERIRGAWWIKNFKKRQTSESLERVRKFRERQKQRYSNVTVTDDVTDDVTVTLSTSTSASLINSFNSSYGEISTLYENNIGALTPMISQGIDEAITEYGAEWCAAAIQKAVRAEKRSWAYCEGILRGWRRDGFNAAKKNGNASSAVIQNEDGSLNV